MKYTIQEKEILFTRHIKKGNTSEVYVCSKNEFVLKKITKFINHNCYNREIYILKLLNDSKFDWCPILIKSLDNENSFIMTYCGEQMNKTNKPTDYKDQITKILNDMKSINLKHNDIKPTEILVYKSKIYLVDFGWASLIDDFSCGVYGISSKEKPCGIFQDNQSLYFCPQ